jgi:hypothetical protein
MDKENAVCIYQYLSICVLLYVYIDAMEYYSAVKNEIMSFAGKWMELELIMMNEISQAQIPKYHVF